MTVVKITAQDAAPVKTRGDVIDYYKGIEDSPFISGPERVAKLGMEMEQTAYRTDSLRPLNIEEGNVLAAAGQSAGLPIHREPSSTLVETITDPYAPDNLRALLDHTEKRFSDLYKVVSQNNAGLSPFAHLPHIELREHSVVKVPRYKAFWDPPREDMIEAYRSFVYPNFQTSVSYRNGDHLLRIIRLCTALEPLMYLITDASAGFFEGRPIDYCPWMKLKLGRERNGGVPDFYYTARNGEELINAHIDYTLNTPYVFVYWNAEEQLERLEPGRFVSYLQLEDFAPQNFLNYRQAQSESWRRVCNIAMINAPDGRVIGHRAEFNLFNSGLQHQRGTALLLANLIAFNDTFYEGAQALLHDFGIDLENLHADRNMLDKNFQSLYRHNNKFHELSFGGKTLKDFALPLADLVEAGYEGTELSSHIKPVLHILRTGRPDWLVYREVFPSLESLKAYLAAFPDLAKDHPELLSSESCADFVKRELVRSVTA